LLRAHNPRRGARTTRGFCARTTWDRRWGTFASEAERGAVGAGVGGAGEAGGVDADELGVAHEVAPRLDHFDVVAALAQALGDVGAEPVFEAEGSRLFAPGAAEEPTRRLDGGLG